MLDKIKTLDQLFYKEAAKMGVDVREIIDDMSDNDKFNVFLSQYKRKVNPSKVNNASFINLIIKLSSDHKELLDYLKVKYHVVDSLDFEIRFEEYLKHSLLSSDRFNERMDYWLEYALTSNANTLISANSTYEPYTKVKLNDIDEFFNALGFPRLTYLSLNQLSTIVNDNEAWRVIESEYKKYSGLYGMNYMYSNIYEQYFKIKLQEHLNKIDGNISIQIKKMHKSLYGTENGFYTTGIMESLIGMGEFRMKYEGGSPFFPHVDHGIIFSFVSDFEYLKDHFDQYKLKISNILSKYPAEALLEMTIEEDVDKYKSSMSKISIFTGGL
jgi:hypothetical protein